MRKFKIALRVLLKNRGSHTSLCSRRGPNYRSGAAWERTHTHHFYVWDAFHFQTLFLANGINFTSTPQFTGNFFALSFSLVRRSFLHDSKGKGCCAAACKRPPLACIRNRWNEKLPLFYLHWSSQDVTLFKLSLRRGVDIEYWAGRKASASGNPRAVFLFTN